MKNIHVLPTDKPSKLATHYEKMRLIQTPDMWTYEFTKQNIYITSDEKIKEGDWCINPKNNKVMKVGHHGHHGYSSKKIILTTDVDLIKDGVQVIDDEFLQWFVKNPSCEEVEVLKQGVKTKRNQWGFTWKYFIKIPKEEPKQDFPMQKLIDIMENDEELRPKQETLEEFIKRESKSVNESVGIVKGAKWQKEQDKKLYSEEDIEEYAEYCTNHVLTTQIGNPYLSIKEWFEQFKKK